MPDVPDTDLTRRRELLDALGKASELHHHLLLVIVVLVAAQGVTTAIVGANVMLLVALALSVLTLGARLWVFHDLLTSVRLRLRPLLEGEGPTPDAKTRRELD